MSYIFFLSRRFSLRRFRSFVRRDRVRQSDSRLSYDVLNGQDEIELFEEIIFVWFRCFFVDFYFRRNNEVFYVRNFFKIERFRGLLYMLIFYFLLVIIILQEFFIDEQVSLIYRYFIFYFLLVIFCFFLLLIFIDMFEFQILYMFFRLVVLML